ncbi:MAG: hypothetical protein DRN17_03560 [Thermoplasmata archaeon]|nr:MAG: hypothetical protein DRN17_03560 [Thermoplasmata archaeon]
MKAICKECKHIVQSTYNVHACKYALRNVPYSPICIYDEGLQDLFESYDRGYETDAIAWEASAQANYKEACKHKRAAEEMWNVLCSYSEEDLIEKYKEYK